jgi:hypothetical protein
MMKPYLINSAVRETTSDLRWVHRDAPNPSPDNIDIYPPSTIPNAKLQQRRVMVDYWRAGRKRGQCPRHIASQIKYVVGGSGDDIEYVYMTERSEWFDVGFIDYRK